MFFVGWFDFFLIAYFFCLLEALMTIANVASLTDEYRVSKLPEHGFWTNRNLDGNSNLLSLISGLACLLVQTEFFQCLWVECLSLSLSQALSLSVCLSASISLKRTTKLVQQPIIQRMFYGSYLILSNLKN